MGLPLQICVETHKISGEEKVSGAVINEQEYVHWKKWLYLINVKFIMNLMLVKRNHFWKNDNNISSYKLIKSHTRKPRHGNEMKTFRE